MKKLNPLHRLICEATGAKAGDLPLIENIMREEIFHSTLDWQTREQLRDGARQAYARLNEDRELYELEAETGRALFEQMRAEAAARESDTPANRTARELATQRHDTARARLLALLDQTQPTH